MQSYELDIKSNDEVVNYNIKYTSKSKKFSLITGSPRKLDNNTVNLTEIVDYEKGLISEDNLRRITGKNDLHTVTYLELSTHNIIYQPIELIGEFLPSLRELKISDNRINSFRDFGIHLNQLRVLSLIRCGIVDLDGIGAFTNIEELYLSCNKISDISAISMHENLRLFDLEKNCLNDITQLEQLGTCYKLQSLILRHNPIVKFMQYRRIVVRCLPGLQTLDDIHINNEDRIPISDEMVDKSIKKFEDDRIDTEFNRTDNENNLENSYQSFSSPHKTDRMKFQLKMDSLKEDSGSELTHGSDIVFAGNPSSALRRRKDGTNDSPFKKISKPLDDVELPIPETRDRESVTDILNKTSQIENITRSSEHKRNNVKNMLEELGSWKTEHSVAMTGVVSSPKSNTKAKHSCNTVSSPTKSRKQKAYSTPTKSASCNQEGYSLLPYHHEKSGSPTKKVDDNVIFTKSKSPSCKPIGTIYVNKKKTKCTETVMFVSSDDESDFVKPVKESSGNSYHNLREALMVAESGNNDDDNKSYANSSPGLECYAKKYYSSVFETSWF